MDMLLKIMGASLGILVPILFIYAVKKGISNSQLGENDKKHLHKYSMIIIILWAALVWALSLTSVFGYSEGDTFPRFLLPLFIPVIIGVGLLFNKKFNTIIDNIPLATLVGVQTFRLAGFAFLLIVAVGILPHPFASGGYGDIATGALALISGLLLAKKRSSGKLFFLLFSAIGLLDLMNVTLKLLTYCLAVYFELSGAKNLITLMAIRFRKKYNSAQFRIHGIE